MPYGKRPALLLLLAALAALLLAAPDARACSCIRASTVLQEFEWADVVVVARVVSVEKDAPQTGAPEGRMTYGGIASAKLTAEKVFKGGVKAGDLMTFAQGGGGDCIWTFSEEAVGQQLLFYLKRPKGADGPWVAGICGRSGPAEDAGDDLLFLNKLDEVRGKTRLSGTVGVYDRKALSVEGRLIRVTGGGTTREVRTDKDGVYELYDLPPGRYAVVVETPRGWKLRVTQPWRVEALPPADQPAPPGKIQAVVEARKHTALDIEYEIDNAVRGQVFDPHGKTMKDVCVYAVPAEGDEDSGDMDCTDAGGNFSISVLPAGSYVLVVNKEGVVSSSQPFGAFYYPNVAEREKASVITLGPGDVLEGVNIYAPSVRETVRVEGVLLYADGKPAVDVNVTFAPGGQPAGVEGRTGGKSDAEGRFSFKVLKGLEGELYGWIFVYPGEYENCPRLDAIIKAGDGSTPEIKTPAVKFHAAADLRGLLLRFPFPACKKAKRRDGR